jgi:hypothetical protein
MARLVSLILGLGLLSSSTCYAGQSTPSRPPVIDVHTHITAEDGPRILDGLNIRYALVMGDRERWATIEGMANRHLPSLSFPCPDGVPLFFGGTKCYATGTVFPDVAWVRGEVLAGRIKAFGEVLSQFLGLAPGDSRLAPYWTLAEEFDVPFGIHMAPAPPGIAYAKSPMPRSHPEFKVALGDPLLLEEVLLRHQRLRLFVMHAGWPRLESMLALLSAHPNVYLDTGGLQSDRIVPRAGYYTYLRSLVENGFGKRIMFGSDFPDQVAMGIDAIAAADFLSAEQKADILCNNAARFLRLEMSICQP